MRTRGVVPSHSIREELRESIESHDKARRVDCSGNNNYAMLVGLQLQPALSSEPYPTCAPYDTCAHDHPLFPVHGTR